MPFDNETAVADDNSRKRNPKRTQELILQAAISEFGERGFGAGVLFTPCG